MAEQAVKKGHPPGLYVLFGTEAAERFSFYTMRAILILYLAKVVFADMQGGEQVIRDEALKVYATYLLLVYLSGLLGGYFADKILGARKAIFLGGIVMGTGLFVMGSQDLLYYGLALVIAGNAFFKPNISTIVSGLYEEKDPRRDGAFTIFYMGINLGALIAIFGAGYAENLFTGGNDWGFNVGFLLAGGAMVFSLLLFQFGQRWLGIAGFPPGREVTEDSRLNARDWLDILIWSVGISALMIGFVFIWSVGLGPLMAKIPTIVQLIMGLVLLGAGIGGFVFTNRDNSKQEWERVGAIVVLSVFVIFFWMGFEQAGGTMNLFAYDQTDRLIQKPVGDKDVDGADAYRAYFAAKAEAAKEAQNDETEDSEGHEESESGADGIADGAEEPTTPTATTGDVAGDPPPEGDDDSAAEDSAGGDDDSAAEQPAADDDSAAAPVPDDVVAETAQPSEEVVPSGSEATADVEADEAPTVPKGYWLIPATVFQGVNPLFIILLAPLFARFWGWSDKKRWGLSTPAKMGVGMIVLGLGFVVMYFGQQVADTYGLAGIEWLVMVYLLHTLGELCLSPIGLSMVTKLSPVRRVSLMMGVWFACTAVADYLSGRLEAICHHYDISLWTTLILFSFGAGVVLLAITPLLKKWMHGRA